MARSIPTLTLGLALAGLLGAGTASAQSPANNTGEVQNPNSTDNARRPGNTVPSADTDAMARPAQDANVHSTDNKDRAAEPGAGVSAGSTGNAEAGNPHSVKNKDHHGRRHHKKGSAAPVAAPVPPPADK
jgi:hypothetical protein